MGVEFHNMRSARRRQANLYPTLPFFPLSKIDLVQMAEEGDTEDENEDEDEQQRHRQEQQQQQQAPVVC